MIEPLLYKTANITLFNTNIYGVDYEDKNIIIYKEGYIKVKEGFKWNGCSPKFVILDILIGTPEGRPISSTNLYPITYYASMIHDALYRSNAPITRKQADICFYENLKDYNFKLAKLYYLAVRMFGWRTWQKRNKYYILKTTK